MYVLSSLWLKLLSQVLLYFFQHSLWSHIAFVGPIQPTVMALSGIIFFHDLNPWNSRNTSNRVESTSIWFYLLCIGLSSNGVESTSMWFSLLCIGLLLLLFAKWLWTNEILHNKILLYFIHFLWELTTCVVYNISTYEKLVIFESSKWARIPTSLQVLGLYIPCSPRFCHLL